jgi:Cd2+/Zn2+-exporting ATPase
MGVLLQWDVGSFSTWLYRALVLLVISCPCALVVSTPVAIVSAITRGTRDGVLVKGGAYLELAAKVRAVAFDKTGTLTRGRPEVVDVVAAEGFNRARVLQVAATLEQHSNHPLARAVVAAARHEGLPPTTARQFEELPGRGVTALVAEQRVTLGSPVFAHEMGALGSSLAALVEASEGTGASVLVLIDDGSAIGFIALADEVRDEARDAVRALRAAGIEHAVMLTGDNERTAAAIAARVGMTGHMARLLPEEKTRAVHRLRERYGVVAMVGDGINDAPALAAADIGIAMGAAGSDTAIETADVALMRDDLMALAGFVQLGRRTVANITQNVTVSILVKLAVLVLAVLGRATLWMAVLADTGVALLVILNGLRLLRKRPA